MLICVSFSGVSNSLAVMLLGRFLVGTGMGLGPPVAALYVTEVYQCTPNIELTLQEV